MGPCIVSIFQYISNKMQSYTAYLYLETALHVSDGTSTQHQERIQMYLQHLVFVTPLVLPAAIVEELEIGVSVLWVAYATHSTLTPVSSSSTIAAGISNGVTNTRCCRYSCMRSSKHVEQFPGINKLFDVASC